MGYDLIDRVVARRRAEREEARKRVLARTIELLSELAPRYGFQRAVIFGSLAQPYRFHEESDVDIAVGGLSPVAELELLTEISRGLDRDVDVVDPARVHFRQRIEREGIEWTPRR